MLRSFGGGVCLFDGKFEEGPGWAPLNWVVGRAGDLFVWVWVTASRGGLVAVLNTI